MQIKHHLNKDVHEYMLQIGLRSNELIDEGYEHTAREIGIDMHSPPEQLQFYSWIVSTLKPKSILEIGTFSGLSTLIMAENSLAETVITTIDHNSQFLEVAEKVWKKSPNRSKIHSILGKAERVLQTKVNEHCIYDLILIDANKNQTPLYYDLAHKLCRPGSVIMLDNIFFSGRVPNKDHIDTSTSRGRNHKKYAESIHRASLSILHDNRVNIAVIPIGDGLTLATVK